MATNWPALLEQYERLRGSNDKPQSRRLRAAIKEELSRPLSKSDGAWFAATLADDDRKYFVAFALKQGLNTAAVPLLEPLIRAAVYDTDLSFNRFFVKPRVDAWLAEDDPGSPRIPRLGKRLQEGWRGKRSVLVDRVLEPSPQNIEDAVPDPAESEGETPGETWRRFHAMMLEEFVRNPDLHVGEASALGYASRTTIHRICARSPRRPVRSPWRTQTKSSGSAQRLRTCPARTRRSSSPPFPIGGGKRTGTTSRTASKTLPSRPVQGHTLWVDQEGTPDTPLTLEEKQVLQLLAQWRSGTEIAATLGLPPESVREHIQILLVKFHSPLRQPDPPPLPPAASAALADPFQQAEDVPTHVAKPLRRKSGSALHVV